MDTNKQIYIGGEGSSIYIIGDATDLSVSKSGSATHFEAHVVAK